MFYGNRIPKILILTAITLAFFATSCSAQQTEEQALRSLREMTKDGKLPPESVVTNLESRFAGKRTGVLARLLHARIRFENKDFTGAAALLNSDEFRLKTNLGDHALWLRGQALQQAGDHKEAMNVFAKLINDFRASIRIRDSKLLWANSAFQIGKSAEVPAFLAALSEKNDADALLLTGKAFEAQGSQAETIKYYRRLYFFAPGTAAAKEAEAKLTLLGQPLLPQNAEEAVTRADKFFATKNYASADKAYSDILSGFPSAVTSLIKLKKLTALSNLKKMTDARAVFDLIPSTAKEKQEAFYQLAVGYAKAKLWPQARHIVDEMRQKFPSGDLTPKTFVDAGMAARDAKNKAEESYYLQTALTVYPNAIEVAGAQFELAWLQHDSGNFAQSSQMFTEHLARYAEKDTTNRGKAGYWAARDAERSGKTAEACELYNAVLYRYSANWYGYLAFQRITSMKGQGKCQSASQFPANSLVSKAAANLKTITVAAEISTAKELERAEKSEQLSTIGLFDWAIDELNEAKKTANTSPKLNLALAKHYRLKGDNVSAFLALAKSYPDYAQMFPEEMGRDEWGIFYPLANWDQISAWSKNRNLDQYQVAGLIRQESVFNSRAHSGANAYGLMQLLLPTARIIARKYGSTADLSSAETLYLPAANIELGTAFMRDQFDKFGRIEYVAVAYNAGPNRVPQWRATLPFEIDEFVEAIPFKETKAYVQGVIRNSAQYRRLYDQNGNFKPNVGSHPLRSEIDSKPAEQFTAEFPDVVVDGNGGE